MSRYSEVLDEQDMLEKWLNSDKGARYIDSFCKGYEEITLSGVRPTRDRAADARSYMAVMKTIARYGQPFFWSTKMCELLESAAETIPEWRLEEELLPAQHGFMWFERPLQMTPAVWTGDIPKIETGQESVATPDPIKAIGWVSSMYQNPETFERQKSVTVAMIVSEEYTKDVLQASARGSHGVPAGVTQWDVGNTITDEWLKAMDPADPRNMPFQHEAWEKRYVEGLRYFAASMLLLNQNIFVARKEQPDRATRRRVARPRDINVVYLRRAMHSDGSHRSTSEMEYAYQWFVNSFWRYEGACEGCRNAHSRCRHNLEGRRPVFVPRHIRGPEDKPLKDMPKIVHAVVR